MAELVIRGLDDAAADALRTYLSLGGIKIATAVYMDAHMTDMMIPETQQIGTDKETGQRYISCAMYHGVDGGDHTQQAIDTLVDGLQAIMSSRLAIGVIEGLIRSFGVELGICTVIGDGARLRKLFPALANNLTDAPHHVLRRPTGGWFVALTNHLYAKLPPPVPAESSDNPSRREELEQLLAFNDDRPVDAKFESVKEILSIMLAEVLRRGNQ